MNIAIAGGGTRCGKQMNLIENRNAYHFLKQFSQNMGKTISGFTGNQMKKHGITRERRGD